MDKTLLLLPGPVIVAEPVLEASGRPMIDHRGPEFAALLERITHALQPVFGTKGEVVLLGSSGTGGLEAAIVNAFSPGDVLLSCPVGVFGLRFAAIARAYGCTIQTIETPAGNALDPQALAAHLEADVDRHIAGVLLTHNETSTGVQNDMAAIAPIVRRHGALSLVDSVSGLGASEFRMDIWGFDIVVTASQKALAAPPGACMIAMSPRACEAMETSGLPRFYFDLRRAREFTREWQTPFTPPIATLAALDAALTRYHATGMPAAFERHARYSQAVRTALSALGFDPFSQPNAHSVTVVAARPPNGIAPFALLQLLRDRYDVVLSGGQAELRGKIVRFGTMGDLTEDDVLRAVEAVERALIDLGGACVPGSGTTAALAVLADRSAGSTISGDRKAAIPAVERTRA